MVQLEDVLRFVQTATNDELNRIHRAIVQLTPRHLQGLPEDALLKISTLLSQDDCIAFLEALLLHPEATDMRLFTSHPHLARILLKEVGVRGVRREIERIADYVHYMLPSCFQVRAVVLCNWSCFGGTSPARLAEVYWTSAHPFARVKYNECAMSRAISRALSRRCCVLRLGAYVCSLPGGTVQTVPTTWRKNVQHVLTHPMQERTVNVFAQNPIMSRALQMTTIRYG